MESGNNHNKKKFSRMTVAMEEVATFMREQSKGERLREEPLPEL